MDYFTHFYNHKSKIKAARAFLRFCWTNWCRYRNSVGIFPALGFRNLGSLAVRQTEVPRLDMSSWMTFVMIWMQMYFSIFLSPALTSDLNSPPVVWSRFNFYDDLNENVRLNSFPQPWDHPGWHVQANLTPDLNWLGLDSTFMMI